MKNTFLKPLVTAAYIMVFSLSTSIAEDNFSLPDPLTDNSGKKITTVSQWQEVRRPEILELFRRHVYGRAPVGRPDNITFKMLETSDKALDGNATRKQVRVYLTGNTTEPYMDILIYLPNGRPRPVKLFAGLNFGGNHTIQQDNNIIKKELFSIYGQCERGYKNSRWPVELILQRGYGVATIHCADLDPDKFDDFKDGVHGVFDPPGYQTDRPDDAWGTVGAWAWGLSRAMDYFETDADIDHTHVAVLGHSRLGKTALWAGARDERFALVISNNSGCTGAALARNKKGESVKRINTVFPHWFCANYSKFNDKEDDLPVDQHELIALMAPRPVYVASASQDAWADPEGEFLSCVYAGDVYELFGLQGVGANQMPKPQQPLHTGHIGYHLRAGKHDLTKYDWEKFMDFADKHWKDAEKNVKTKTDADYAVLVNIL
jgi:hypothetical protein